MKNLPLFMQIWIVIASITVGISILLAALFPVTIREFFTKEMYATIENAQTVLLVNESPSRNFEQGMFIDRRQHMETIRTVNHIFLLDQDRVVTSIRTGLPRGLVSVVREQVLTQTQESQRYSMQINDRKIFYVINKGDILGQEIAVASYMWDSYRDDLGQALFKQLLMIMGLVFLLSWIPSILLAKYLSKPLTSLGDHVTKLANRDWNNQIQLDRNDEIGKLGDSIEQLRKQIILQDEAQQSLLQHASHELKTPVMVIRSYAQSIADGIYPKGGLVSTVQVIEEEAERLEKRIRDLLYITKLDFLATHQPYHESFDLKKLIIDVIERLGWKRTELQWRINLEQTTIRGDREQWCVAIENLLDNQIRYADQQIEVQLQSITNKGGQIVSQLRFWNDGPPIEAEVMERLFQKFSKGYKGEFGLGLAIVQRIANLHQASIDATNEDVGVSFTIKNYLN